MAGESGEEFVRPGLRDGSRRWATSVVDEDLDGTDTPHIIPDHAIHLLAVGEVNDEVVVLRAYPGHSRKLVLRAAERFLVAREQCDAPTESGEFERACAADTSGAAADEGALSR